MGKFIVLSGVLTGSIIGALIMLSAQLAFADVTWTEATESGVIVHTESDSVSEEDLSWSEMINERMRLHQKANDEWRESEYQRKKPELEQLKHDLWLGTKSFWEKLLM